MNASSNRPKLLTRTNNYLSRLINIPATGLTRQNGSRFLIKPNNKKSLTRQNGSRNLTRTQRRKNYRKSRKLRR